MQRIADTAVRELGDFIAWVNVAAVIIYGRLEETPLEDARRLFDVDFWGAVNGSLVAVRQLKARGGALINVGSTESDRALPLHGVYAASKHALKAFTDALRMELEADGAPVSVTLVKPGSIDTPLPTHAKTLVDREPSLPPPVYAPDVVARAILDAAVHPRRDVFVGAGGKLISTAGRWAPRMTDRLMERTMFRMQQKDAPAHAGDNLRTPSHQLRERGDHPGRV